MGRREERNTNASSRYWQRGGVSGYDCANKIYSHLALLDLVPTLNEVLHDIEHSLAGEGHVNVVPRHARSLERTQAVADVVGDVLEVHDARVVVVLPREERAREVERVRVGERVRVCVPAAEAEVEPADARAVVVDDDDLFVVRPVFDVVW